MTFNLSSVMAYVCGAEVPELQLSFFAADPADRFKAPESPVSMRPLAPVVGDNKEKDEADRRIGVAPANAATNKPSRSAEWLWRARSTFTTAVLAKKEKIVAPPPPPPKRPRAGMSRSTSNSSAAVTTTTTATTTNTATSSAFYHQHSNSLPSPLLSRGGAVPLTDVVAQALLCLDCRRTPSSSSAAARAAGGVDGSVMPPPPPASPPREEEVRWGVPRWPGCTVTIHAAADTEQGVGKGQWGGRGKEVASDADNDEAPETVAAENIIIRWFSPARAMLERMREENAAAAAPVITTTTTAATSTVVTLLNPEGYGEDTEEADGDASSRLVVRMRCDREQLETAAPSLSAALPEKGVVMFYDPVVLPPPALPSRVLPPSSLLLPDVVCLRHVPPPRPSSTATYRTSYTLLASGAAAGDAASSADGPMVEVLLVAVEALPELYETRRQGLLLYKEVLLRHYATKKADAVARRRYDDSDDFPFSPTQVPPELPSLRWRCELWTPPPEGRAGQPPPTSAAAPENGTDGIVCRTVVQAGVFSMYARNKSAVTPPSTSLSIGAYPALAASAATAAPPHLSSFRMRLMDRDESPPHAERAPSPVLRTPLSELELQLRTFCRWWADMEQLTRRLAQPASLALSVDVPVSSVPGNASFTAAPVKTASSSGRQANGSTTVDLSEDAAWMHATVTQLLRWWAAKSVRVLPPAVATLSTAPSRRLPPLPSGATPLFGAVVIPSYVRAPASSAATAAAGVGAAAELAIGSPSPPVLSLPALTLCFVNPRGAYVHQYDLEALNVLCRAVHTLHAVVCVFDAAQKAALLAWIKCFVRPYSSPPPAPLAATSTTATAVTAAAAPAATGLVGAASSISSTRSSSTSSVVHHVNPGSFSASSSIATTTTAAAASATTAAAAATATVGVAGASPSVVPYLEYPYDALAEVERNCVCLEDYVYERHCRALADGEDDAADEETKREKVKDATGSATPLLPQHHQQQFPFQLSASQLVSCGIVEKARSGAVPSRGWCHDARVLAPADFVGRRRLDVFTCPLRRKPPPLSTSSAAATAGPLQQPTATAAALTDLQASSATSQPPPPPPRPPLALNPVPPSFLSYVLTRIGDNGVEEVEHLSGTLMQMGRRLSGG